MTLLRALRAGTIILAMIVGFVAGTALGLRVFKVLALVPLIMLMLVFAVATSVTATIDVRAYNMLLAIVSPQMGYLFGILVLASRRYVVAQYLWARSSVQRSTMLSSARKNIGQELRATFEVPRNIRDDMLALLAQIGR
jgi:hypothetical protein